MFPTFTIFEIALFFLVVLFFVINAALLRRSQSIGAASRPWLDAVLVVLAAGVMIVALVGVHELLNVMGIGGGARELLAHFVLLAIATWLVHSGLTVLKEGKD